MYLVSFFVAAGVSLASCAVLVAARKFFRTGRGGVSRLGGVAIIAAFFAAALLHPDLRITPDMYGLFLGGVAILIFGLLDDAKNFSWKTQIVFQLALSAAMFFFFGARVESMQGIEFSALAAFVATIMWFVFLINALNWSDGSDGVGGAVVIAAAAALFFVALRGEVNQPPTAILCAALAGAAAGFLFLNISPARIFMGTSGAYFGGFVLAYVAIFAGAKIATALIVLALPILDALWVIVQRRRDGVSIFSADRERHLHFQLARRGWGPMQIFLLFSLFLALSVLSALFGRGAEKVFFFLLLAVAYGAFSLFFISRRERSY